MAVQTQAPLLLPPDWLPDDTPVATAKNMPGDSADLFGDGTAEDGGAANGRLWRTVIIGEQEHRIDLHMIRPYMKVVTHGGERSAPTSAASRAGCAPLRAAVSPTDLCLARGRGGPRQDRQRRDGAGTMEWMQEVAQSSERT